MYNLTSIVSECYCKTEKTQMYRSILLYFYFRFEDPNNNYHNLYNSL